MKQVTIILMILSTGLSRLLAQNPSERITTFREKILPQYSVYFTMAELTETGLLKLSANEIYNPLPINSKKVVMNNLSKAWQESLILVQFKTKSELWGWNGETGKALLIDGWDLNAPVKTTAATTTLKASLHPWFVYIGGQGQLDKNHEVSLGFNSRVGFFLLRNRWDLAWTISAIVLGNIDSDAPMTNQFSTGLMSKVYFPIKKLNISPNVGMDIQSTAYMSSEGTTSSTARSASLLAGISWFISDQGSMDVGVRIGREVSAIIGFTYFPRFGSNKKRSR